MTISEWTFIKKNTESNIINIKVIRYIMKMRRYLGIHNSGTEQTIFLQLWHVLKVWK